MADATINLLYNELKRMRQEMRELKEVHRDIRELRQAIIPEEKMSAAERKELHATLAQMKAGKERNWREAFGK